MRNLLTYSLQVTSLLVSEVKMEDMYLVIGTLAKHWPLHLERYEEDKLR